MTLFEYRDYFTLNEAESLQQFWRVRSDLERLSLASYFAEVMEAVAVEGRPDPMALSLILNSLYALDRLNRPLALVKAAFEAQAHVPGGVRAPAGRLRGVRRAGAGAASVPPERGGALLRRLPDGGGEGAAVPLEGGALAAMRHIVYGDPKRLFSFRLEGRACPACPTSASDF